MAFPLLFDAMIPRSLFQARQREGYDAHHALDLDFSIVQVTGAEGEKIIQRVWDQPFVVVRYRGFAGARPP